jgi:hypothetical protein
MPSWHCQARIRLTLVLVGVIGGETSAITALAKSEGVAMVPTAPPLGSEPEPGAPVLDEPLAPGPVTGPDRLEGTAGMTSAEDPDPLGLLT